MFICGSGKEKWQLISYINHAYLNFSEDGQYFLKVLIPSYAAGSIIGKGGQTIVQLQKETGATIKLSKSKDFYPGRCKNQPILLFLSSLACMYVSVCFIYWWSSAAGSIVSQKYVSKCNCEYKYSVCFGLWNGLNWMLTAWNKFKVIYSISAEDYFH